MLEGSDAVTQEMEKIARESTKGPLIFNLTVMGVFIICAGGTVAGCIMVLGRALGLW